jgi:hypothetical protein
MSRTASLPAGVAFVSFRFCAVSVAIDTPNQSRLALGKN